MHHARARGDARPLCVVVQCTACGAIDGALCSVSRGGGPGTGRRVRAARRSLRAPTRATFDARRERRLTLRSVRRPTYVVRTGRFFRWPHNKIHTTFYIHKTMHHKMHHGASDAVVRRNGLRNRNEVAVDRGREARTYGGGVARVPPRDSATIGHRVVSRETDARTVPLAGLTRATTTRPPHSLSSCSAVTRALASSSRRAPPPPSASRSRSSGLVLDVPRDVLFHLLLRCQVRLQHTQSILRPTPTRVAPCRSPRPARQSSGHATT